MAAIEIEKYIKELSEQELRDETIVKVILQYCFDDKKDMSAMTKGNSLDKIPLISKVYFKDSTGVLKKNLECVVYI